jgi:hypothetical protein
MRHTVDMGHPVYVYQVVLDPVYAQTFAKDSNGDEDHNNNNVLRHFKLLQRNGGSFSLAAADKSHF